ncbi:uncharacterized protein [Halyomorpha halys]|uniref:uncharacterized protein n=1 Tax=Halyomorpha halys TaxID=286706 RepID=UPI0006D5056E|nr:uncharacterized protein LOC106688037 [Halyomorpha halys]XP_024217919.1 uncharacterized protein LOC106688037 [Halyomorpha halys]XP_024217920.1 uncharacterized protein LOC106688037 [Halyomorpha halys]XP_024217923.1 uncharacterized protein LOC106688037 [Halyomorpha halys]
MANLSTMDDKKLKSLDGNEATCISYFNDNEEINFKNNSTGFDSPFFGNISAINRSANVSRVAMFDQESDEPENISVIGYGANISRHVTSDHETDDPENISAIGSGTNIAMEVMSDHESDEPKNTSTIGYGVNISREVMSGEESNEPENPSTIAHGVNISREVMSGEESNEPENSSTMADGVNISREVMSGEESNEPENPSTMAQGVNISREVMSDEESNEADTTIVHHETSSAFKNLTDPNEFDSDSDCSVGVNYTFKEMDVNEVSETILEMSQAVQKYMNKIKQLNISVEWELPNTLIPEKGLRKSEGGLKGPLDPEEVSFIKKRLRQFCEEYGINYSAIRACLAESVSKFHFPNELRLKFVQYVCKDYVNDRNAWTVFRAITKLGLRKGKFSEEEINFLDDMYHNYKGSCLHSVCGLILNRHRHHIYRKIERLKAKGFLGSRPSSNNVKSKPLKLRNSILKSVLNRKHYDLENLKSRLNTRSWISIGREYNVSPALAKAIYICELCPQIHAVHPVKFHRFFSKLFYRIKYCDWIYWDEVKWTELSTMLYDVGPVFVYVMLRKIIMHCVPKEKWNNFRECAEYLFKTVLPYFENGRKKITLNRILIVQGKNND